MQLQPFEQEQMLFCHKNSVCNELAFNTFLQLCEQRITPSANRKVTSKDLLTFVKQATDYGLDPTSNALYGFIGRDGKLSIGMQNKGWQKVLATQRDKFKRKINITYKYPEPQKRTVGDKTITVLDYVECNINVDGQEYSRRAWFDEEYNRSNQAWSTRPKRMLETRAFCMAMADCFGIGVYELDDISTFVDNVNVQGDQLITPAAKSKKTKEVKEIAVQEAVIVEDSSIEPYLEQLKTCTSIEELRDTFKSFPSEIKANKELIEKSQEIAKNFIEE